MKIARTDLPEWQSVGSLYRARPSVSLDDDRRCRRYSRRAARRRARVFPDLLSSAQRVARAGRRHRHRRRARDGDAVLRRPRSWRRAAAGGGLRSRLRRVRATAPARGSRRIAAAIPRRGTRRRCSPQDDAELDLVAEVLASGKTSRLYRTLVYEHRIATEIAASQNSRELGGLLPDHCDRGAGAHARRAASARFSTRSTAFIDEGPTAAEMERCLAQAEANFIYRLQTVGGFGGKSDQLNAYNVFLGDPGFFRSRSRSLPAGDAGGDAAGRARVAAAATRACV